VTVIGSMNNAVTVSGGPPCTFEEIRLDMCSMDWRQDGAFCAIDTSFNSAYNFEETEEVAGVCQRT
jgi:hypothetical protein